MSSPSQSDNVSLLVALLLDFISVWDKKPDKGRAKKSKQHQKDMNKTDLGPEQGNDEHLLQFEDCENMEETKQLVPIMHCGLQWDCWAAHSSSWWRRIKETRRLWDILRETSSEGLCFLCETLHFAAEVVLLKKAAFPKHAKSEPRAC